MSQPQRQNVAQISAELGIPVVTLYNWRKALRLQGEVMPEYEKDPKGWVSTDKFKVVLPTAGLNTTELNAYCRKRGLYQQVGRWRQASKELCSPQASTMCLAVSFVYISRYSFNLSLYWAIPLNPNSQAHQFLLAAVTGLLRISWTFSSKPGRQSWRRRNLVNDLDHFNHRVISQQYFFCFSTSL